MTRICTVEQCNEHAYGGKKFCTYHDRMDQGLLAPWHGGSEYYGEVGLGVVVSYNNKSRGIEADFKREKLEKTKELLKRVKHQNIIPSGLRGLAE